MGGARAGMVLFFHAPATPAENILAVSAHLVFCAFVGIVFAYALELASSRYAPIKGLLTGLIVGGTIWAVTFLFRLRPQGISTAACVIVDAAGAAVFGTLLALFYRVFYRRDACPS